MKYFWNAFYTTMSSNNIAAENVSVISVLYFPTGTYIQLNISTMLTK